jgi:hypothetical protein
VPLSSPARFLSFELSAAAQLKSKNKSLIGANAEDLIFSDFTHKFKQKYEKVNANNQQMQLFLESGSLPSEKVRTGCSPKGIPVGDETRRWACSVPFLHLRLNY